MSGTRVTLTVALTEGATLSVDRELEHLLLMVGRWFVELVDGDLIVRSARDGHVEALRVPAS